jgi:hypothetical protein
MFATRGVSLGRMEVRGLFPTTMAKFVREQSRTTILLACD